MSTIICVIIVIGVFTIMVVGSEILLDQDKESYDKIEYEVSTEDMLIVVSSLMSEISLTPHEEVVLTQLIELLESRKEGE